MIGKRESCKRQMKNSILLLLACAAATDLNQLKKINQDNSLGTQQF